MPTRQRTQLDAVGDGIRKGARRAAVVAGEGARLARQVEVGAGAAAVLCDDAEAVAKHVASLQNPIEALGTVLGLGKGALGALSGIADAFGKGVGAKGTGDAPGGWKTAPRAEESAREAPRGRAARTTTATCTNPQTGREEVIEVEIMDAPSRDSRGRR